MNIIARFRSPLKEKFGLPRQAGLSVHLKGTVVLEEGFRRPEALKGLEGFDYIWLIWQFSEAVRDDWSPTVRPPRLGGNQRMGVFATRSPFRPNAIGLSSVRLLRVEIDSHLGPVLHISGADIMDGTPIYDIKPYLPYTDSHPDARSGFAVRPAEQLLAVQYDDAVLTQVPEQLRASLLDILAHDPRPQYQHDPDRIYGMAFANMEVKFRVQDTTLTLLTVTK